MVKQEIVSKLFDKGILVTKEIVDLIEKGTSYETILQLSEQTEKPQESTKASVTVVKSYVDNPKDITVKDFISHYQIRLEKLTAILQNRTELENITSIRRVQQKRESEKVSVIGYVVDIYETRNGHLSLTIEDKTGKIRALALKKDDKMELFEQAKNLVYDDIIGICGTTTQGKDQVIFIDTIVFPDIPNGLEYKKCPDDVNAVFIGDLHVGAKKFLTDDFNRFLDWLNQKSPDPLLNAEAKKVKYLIIIGDIIEGVGWYPNQEHDLAIKPFREQYQKAAEFFSRIPPHIHVIITPGNHDIMRLSEPQPPIYQNIAPQIYDLPNVTMVSSPSIVNIHKTPEFAGFNLLLYHGYSFFYYVDNVEQIRKEGGIDRMDLVMEFLLKRRHLAPAHTSTLYLPDHDRDELVIEQIPDFFVTGHVHKSVVKRYKHITLLNCSTFVDITDYQKKQGMVPDLAKIPCVNLKTRNVRIIDFHED